MSNKIETNPLLEPIHGISLKDYAAIALKMTSGVSESEIFKALGIDGVVWDEVNTLWPKRMQEDNSFTVTSLYGQYFMEGAVHPQLEHLQPEVNEAGKANLDRMKTDRYFYEELNGARQAAYEYGLDGAQWIQDQYSINLGDFQSVTMHWINHDNKDDNGEKVIHFLHYRREMQNQYAEHFAKEQGGNVADDIEF